MLQQSVQSQCSIFKKCTDISCNLEISDDNRDVFLFEITGDSNHLYDLILTKILVDEEYGSFCVYFKQQQFFIFLVVNLQILTFIRLI